MKSLFKPIVIFFICGIIFSCNRGSSETNNVNDSIPKALQEKDDSFELLSKRGAGDLVDDIYNDLVEKNPKFKKLETDIEQHRVMNSDSLAKYNKYLLKSEQYYTAALEDSRIIKDSVMKKEMKQLIEKNKTKYNHLAAALIAQIDSLSNVQKTLEDEHTALKILVTLPIINKFQRTQLPNDKELHVLLTEKQKLIEQIKQLMQKQ